MISLLSAALLIQFDASDLPRIPVDQARAEISTVYEHIVENHPSPFWFNDEAVWEDRVSELLALSEPPTHVEHYFHLASLMALAVDTHVQIYPAADTPGFSTTYPIRLRVFEEGIYISAADDPYRDLVGSRIISAGGRDIGDIAEELSHHSFSDNPGRQYTFGVEHHLIQPATYHYLDLIADDGRVALEIERRDGRRDRVYLDTQIESGFREVLSSGESEAYFWPEGWTTLDTISGHPVPLSRSRLSENFWYEIIDDGRTLYVQFNTSSDRDDGETFLAFTLAMFSSVNAMETPPSRIIFDVRYNLGGWILRSLPAAYLSRLGPFCCDTSQTVLLTGPETISAGSVFAGAMEIASTPVVIGQPTGGRPNIYIGHQGFELPYSGLEPEAATVTFIGTDTADNRLQINPDIPVSERFADFMAGRDAALERALSLTEDEAAAFYPGLTGLQPWTRPSQDSARAYTSEP